MRNEQPRFALVCWPKTPEDQAPCCITLDVLPNALARGALFVASEADILPVVTFNTPRLAPLEENGEDGA